jgi:UDP-N-acetylmuramyl pentapeptide synthase
MFKFIAINFVKFSGTIFRLTKFGLNKTFAAKFLNDFKSQLKEPQYDFFITGGNSKSLTRSLLKKILQLELQEEIISNEQTTDSYNGVLTEFISRTNIRGKLNTNNFILEIDPASMVDLARVLKPSTIIINSLSENADMQFDQIISGIKSSLRLQLRNYIVYNIDDIRLQKLPDLLTNYHSFYSYGAKVNDQAEPEFSFEILSTDADLNIVDMGSDDKHIQVKLPRCLEIYDITAAAAAAYWSGIRLEEIKKVLETLISD